jgi:hypothetical protein
MLDLLHPRRFGQSGKKGGLLVSHNLRIGYAHFMVCMCSRFGCGRACGADARLESGRRHRALHPLHPSANLSAGATANVLDHPLQRGAHRSNRGIVLSPLDPNAIQLTR